MNEYKIAFIICTNNKVLLDECLMYLSFLHVPQGFETEILTIEDAKSITSGYNEAMHATDAKYKVYMHQDVMLINRNFIEDLLTVFSLDDNIGMVGLVGYEKMADDYVMWHEPRVGCNPMYGISDRYKDISSQDYRFALHDGIYNVQVCDGMLIATCYDIEWDEANLDGWDFYDASQCARFIQNGYRIVVPKEKYPWFIHEDGHYLSLFDYSKYKDIFKEKYSENILRKQEKTYSDDIRKELARCAAKTYYCGQKDSVQKKNLLVVSHSLLTGGAPIVLCELVDSLKERYNVFFIAMNEGELDEAFISKGIDIFVGRAEQFEELKRRFVEWFDAVFLNTLVSFPFIPFFQDTKVPTLVWIHEPEEIFERAYGRMIPMDKWSNNIIPLGVSSEPCKSMKKYYGIYADRLPVGLSDCYKETEEKKRKGKTTFFFPATIQYLKGHDILFDAIEQMPESLKQKCEFVLAGALGTDEEINRRLNEIEREYPDLIKYLGVLPRADVYMKYNESDCVISLSRKDSLPTTIAEGMMHRRICLCSDATGISENISNGKNGFVFKSENITDFINQIDYIQEHIDELDNIRDNARKTFLMIFDRDTILTKIYNILNA